MKTALTLMINFLFISLLQSGINRLLVLLSGDTLYYNYLSEVIASMFLSLFLFVPYLLAFKLIKVPAATYLQGIVTAITGVGLQYVFVMFLTINGGFTTRVFIGLLSFFISGLVLPFSERSIKRFLGSI